MDELRKAVLALAEAAQANDGEGLVFRIHINIMCRRKRELCHAASL